MQAIDLRDVVVFGLRLPDREPEVGFAELDAFETVTRDYRASGHSTRGW